MQIKPSGHIIRHDACVVSPVPHHLPLNVPPKQKCSPSMWHIGLSISDKPEVSMD